MVLSNIIILPYYVYKLWHDRDKNKVIIPDLEHLQSDTGMKYTGIPISRTLIFFSKSADNSNQKSFPYPRCNFKRAAFPIYSGAALIKEFSSYSTM